MKLKAAAVIAAMGLLAVSILSGCSSDTKDFADIMTGIPVGSSDFGYWDVGKLSTDEDLAEIYAEFRSSRQAEQLMNIGLGLFVLDRAARASGIDGEVTVLEGDLNGKDIERRLRENDYIESRYRDTGIWTPQDGEGDDSLGLQKDRLLVAGSDYLRSCIDTVAQEQVYSLYDDQYIRWLVDRLPQGLIVAVHKADSAAVQAYTDIIASGESYRKEGKDKLRLTAIYMFQDSEAADKGGTVIENQLGIAGFTDVKLEQDVNFVRITALIYISDFAQTVAF
ncbi:MAG: hypothetical protein FJ020_08765 [Chloroflexi bacterium]|nr:hypothetical protein [Chloroflexota bacterium]